MGVSPAFQMGRALQCSSQVPGPLHTGPPTKRKAEAQVGVALLPTVLSCFQLGPMYITPDCVFIRTILPRRCKFEATEREETAEAVIVSQSSLSLYGNACPDGAWASQARFAVCKRNLSFPWTMVSQDVLYKSLYK